MPGYVYLWEFDVRPDKAALFERIYGRDGDWAALFRRAAGYVDTLLLKDRTVANRYLTVDRWQSEDAYERFRSEFGAEYRLLDARCEELTLAERSLGTYTD